MAEVTTGLRSVLSSAPVYSLTQRVLSSATFDAMFLADHVHPEAGERVMDLGCGTAAILRAMPDVRYVGVDRHEPYLRSARRRYGEAAEFIRAGVTDRSFWLDRRFDLVLAIGLLHHLDNEQCRCVFAHAADHLEDGGRLVALDGAIEPGQSRVARWLIDRDRGQDVRASRGYAALAEPFFDAVSVSVRDDMIRVPYTYAILECREPRRADLS